ncbi:MAG: hypothetical protein FWG83_04810 [Oscillospiraceae bacterium]|nr:hypothetical protein [Oscillospiraceae bacterium]
MRNLKWLAVALSVCIMAVTFTGCFESFDASKFVKGNIDSVYLGQFDKDFVKTIKESEAEIRQMYENGLETEADFFFLLFEIAEEYIDPAMKKEVIEMYREIYKKAKYEVGESTKSGTTYSVSVTVHPIDVMQRVLEKVEEDWVEDFFSRIENDEFEEMSTEEIETIWARGVIDIAKNEAKIIGYLEPQTITIRVATTGSGNNKVQSINDSDFEKLDELIISYD